MFTLHEATPGVRMDLSNPIRSVIPSVHGAVLAELATAGRPLSGRALAGRIEGQAGYRRVNQVLQALVDAGIARRQSQPPAFLYELNDEHVAAVAVRQLADLRGVLFRAVADAVAAWPVAAAAVWIAGSTMRADGDDAGEIVLLAFRPGGVAEGESAWQRQLAELSNSVTAWSGNDCHVLEYSRAELAALTSADEATVVQLRADTVTVFGLSVEAATEKQLPVSADRSA